MGDFATTTWLLLGILHRGFAAVFGGGRRGLEEEPALGGIFEAFGIENGLGFLNQIVEGFESFVDTGEAHVGHLIEAAEALGDQLADDLAGNFLVIAALDFLFDFIRNPL